MTKFATAVGTTAQILGDDGANPAGPGNPLTVSLEVKGVTHVDRSGTITAGGTAQTLAAAKISRKGMWLQNQSTGEVQISGLPFPAAAGGAVGNCTVAYYVAAAAVAAGIDGFVGSGASVIRLFYPTAGASLALTPAAIGTTPQIYGNVTYRI